MSIFHGCSIKCNFFPTVCSCYGVQTALEQNCCCFQYRLMHLPAHWSQFQEESPLLLRPQITIWRRISSWQLLLLLILPPHAEVQNLRRHPEGSAFLVLQRHRTRSFTVLFWKPSVSPQTNLSPISLNKTPKLKVAWCAICLPLPGIHPALFVDLELWGLNLFCSCWCSPASPDVPLISILLVCLQHLSPYPFFVFY